MPMVERVPRLPRSWVVKWLSWRVTKSSSLDPQLLLKLLVERLHEEMPRASLLLLLAHS